MQFSASAQHIFSLKGMQSQEGKKETEERKEGRRSSVKTKETTASKRNKLLAFHTSSALAWRLFALEKFGA